MKIHLDEQAQKWQTRARRFAEDELIPHEIEAEMNEGRLPPEVAERHHRLAMEMGLSAMDVPREHGGRALRTVDQVAIWEQLGRVTNALSWCFSEPQRWMFDACTPDQVERYVLPLIDGSRKECYAITESGSGSWMEIESTARREDDGYRIDGEKWFVTSQNKADYYFLQARLTEGDHAGSESLFLIDADSSGIEVIETPRFSHTFDHHHPTMRYTDVRVPLANRIGAEGEGMAFTHAWFRRERLMIAARSCGAAARLIEEATAFARERRIGEENLVDKQLVQAMLADSVTELWAARLITFEAAEAHDRGEDVKALHARCSVAKLYASEMAWRVADRALQIFGGRGYMRDNAAERFSREIRVDRIWEGASEIQRLIIARALARRGLEGM